MCVRIVWPQGLRPHVRKSMLLTVPRIARFTRFRISGIL